MIKKEIITSGRIRLYVKHSNTYFIIFEEVIFPHNLASNYEKSNDLKTLQFLRQNYKFKLYNTIKN